MREPLVRPLPGGKIRPQNTALLVIDMERDFVDEGAVQETPGGRDLIPTLNRLSAWARSHHVPVIFTFEMHRADRSDYGIELEYDPVHCLEGTAGCEHAEGLVALPADHRITGKMRYDAFHGTDLDLNLRSRRI